MDERDDPINNAWYDWVARLVGRDVEVVFLQELTGHDAPRPQGQYIGLQITAGPLPKGFDEIRAQKDSSGDPNDKFDLCGERQYTLNIQAFRAGSRQLLARLQTLLDSPDESKRLKESEADIAIVERGGIIDVSALLETGFERRHSMDVVFNSSVNIETDLEPIERVRVSGTGKDGKTGDNSVGPFEVVKP